MSSEVDRAEQFLSIQRQSIAIFTGDAPAVDEHGRDRYFLLLQTAAATSSPPWPSASPPPRSVPGPTPTPGSTRR
jgi:hypothetical protein